MDSEGALSTKTAGLVRAEKPGPPTWNDLAEGFETMGKVGLAVAIGFSAAGIFCRLADQGKVKVPTLSSLVLGHLVAPKPTPQSPEPS